MTGTALGPMSCGTPMDMTQAGSVLSHAHDRPVRTASILCHDLNQPHDMAVQFVQVLGRYPVFLMDLGAHSVHLVLMHEGSQHPEARHEAGVPRLQLRCVPLLCDLGGVLLS